MKLKGDTLCWVFQMGNDLYDHRKKFWPIIILLQKRGRTYQSVSSGFSWRCFSQFSICI